MNHTATSFAPSPLLLQFITPLYPDRTLWFPRLSSNVPIGFLRAALHISHF